MTDLQILGVCLLSFGIVVIVGGVGLLLIMRRMW